MFLLLYFLCCSVGSLVSMFSTSYLFSFYVSVQKINRKDPPMLSLCSGFYSWFLTSALWPLHLLPEETAIVAHISSLFFHHSYPLSHSTHPDSTFPGNALWQQPFQPSSAIKALKADNESYRLKYRESQVWMKKSSGMQWPTVLSTCERTTVSAHFYTVHLYCRGVMGNGCWPNQIITNHWPCLKSTLWHRLSHLVAGRCQISIDRPYSRLEWINIWLNI